MKGFRVGLVDDHPIVLAGLVDLIGKSNRCEVVATGCCAQEARALARDHRLDLLVMDLQMPGDVMEAIAEISHAADAPKVLVFTASDRTDDCVAALTSGAEGYVVKGSSGNELFKAIDVVLGGQEFVSSSLAARMIREMNSRSDPAPEPEVALSYRENQIVTQLLEGATNRDIAERLKLSEKTVKYYMTQIMQKFDARNRVEVVLAVQRARVH